MSVLKRNSVYFGGGVDISNTIDLKRFQPAPEPAQPAKQEPQPEEPKKPDPEQELLEAKRRLDDKLQQVAFREKQIHEGDVLIVRYEGPKGGPGMKELHRITEIIKGIPGTAVITDGRFSGASGGLSIGYLCPEAAEGGPIALVKDGDKIFVDLKKEILHLEVTDEELEARRKAFVPRQARAEKGLLKRYAQTVNSAKTGATVI